MGLEGLDEGLTAGSRGGEPDRVADSSAFAAALAVDDASWVRASTSTGRER